MDGNKEQERESPGMYKGMGKVTGHIFGIREGSLSAAGIHGPGFCPCISVAQYLTGSFSALARNLSLGLKLLFCLFGCCFFFFLFYFIFFSPCSQGISHSEAEMFTQLPLLLGCGFHP